MIMYFRRQEAVEESNVSRVTMDLIIPCDDFTFVHIICINTFLHDIIKCFSIELLTFQTKMEFLEY